MFNKRNYRILMILLIISIWVMYLLNWGFVSNNVLLIASYISIIIDIAILILLTLIVAVFNYILQEERGDNHKRPRKDKRKEIEKDLKKRGFDTRNLKDYLKK